MYNSSMKRIIVVAVITVVMLSTAFIPYHQQTILTVNANFENLANQVMLPQNWLKWYKGIDLSNAQIFLDTPHSKQFVIADGKKTVRATPVTPVSYEVKEGSKSAARYYSFAILSTKKLSQTEIISVHKTSLLRYWFSFFTGGSIAPLQNLKAYLEDKDQFYGYKININPVTDTIFLTTSKLVQKAEVYQAIKHSFQDINQYIKDSGLQQVGDPAIFLRPGPVDSLKLMMGIAVTTWSPGNDQIQSMTMPKGRMLIGKYHGVFRNRQAIYAAMKRYVSDHGLTIVAPDFERYARGKFPENDSSIIDFDLYFPVF